MPAKKKSSGAASTLANRVESAVEKPTADPSRKGNAPWPENDVTIVEVLQPASTLGIGDRRARSRRGRKTEKQPIQLASHSKEQRGAMTTVLQEIGWAQTANRHASLAVERKERSTFAPGSL